MSPTEYWFRQSDSHEFGERETFSQAALDQIRKLPLELSIFLLNNEQVFDDHFDSGFVGLDLSNKQI